MAFYRYKAVDKNGSVRRGRLAAVSVDDVDARLARIGLDLIRCKVLAGGRGWRRRNDATRRDLIGFCFQLEQLLGSGIPLVDALADLRDHGENPHFRELVGGILDLIGEGRSLSEALLAFPRSFDPVFTRLVSIGEQSGTLPQILGGLSEELKWRDELAASARKALAYPAFVAIVVGGAALFLMTYLVPKLMPFINAATTVPVHTRALLWCSELLTNRWYLIVALPVGVFTVLSAAARHPRIRLQLDAVALRLWVVGEIFRNLVLARVARSIALMYRAGVPVLNILEISAGTAGNRAVEAAMAAARQRVANGEGLASGFAATGLFPPLAQRMLSVGETSGALDDALLNLAYFYDRDARERVARLESLLEPMLTVILGAVLAWIALAVLGPIYDATRTLPV